MNPFDRELNLRLDALREEGLYRELRRIDSAQAPRIELDGQTLVNFSSNDYLGLASHPALKQAAVNAIGTFGAGAGSSRLISGSLAPHHELETALAEFKGTEAALSFSTGYAAALGTISALVGKEDVVVIDKLVHACLVDAARLSGAKLRVFAHNDVEDLERILKWAATRPGVTHRASRVLIVTESVFSMGGDHAPLREITALKERYGAWLMTDEAHAIGVYGQNRRGLAEALGVSRQIEIQMGALGKAVGASGGYVCGSRALVDYLINRARSFIFSTAPVPAAAAAATAGIQLLQSAEGKARHDLLWKNIRLAGDGMGRLSIPSPIRKTNQNLPTSAPARQHNSSAILPLIIGDETKAVSIATELRARGFHIPAIRYPTVARGSARLRITLTAAHSNNDIDALASALSQIVNRNS